MQRFIRLTIVTVLAAVAVSACVFSGQQAAPTARTSASSPVSTATSDSSKLIFVVPMQGVASSTGLVLADAIAATLRDASKPAILSPRINKMGPSVSGRIVAQEERGSVVWVTALWELLAPYGTAVAEYRHQVVVDKHQWRQGSAEAINLLVSDAGPQIAKMVHEYVSPIAMTTNLPIAESMPAVPPSILLASSPPPSPSPPIATLVPELPPELPAVLTPAGGTQALPGKPAVKAGRDVIATLGHRKKPSALKPAKKAAKKPPLKPPILRPVPEAEPPARASKPQRMALKMPKPRKTKNAKKTKKQILMPVPESGRGRVNTDPPPVSWNRPSFLIKLVEGAPGDGNAALTKAMKAALRKRDITVTEDPRQAGYVIKGKVEVSAPVGGRQQAKIVWAVNTMGGDKVGKAVQENAIKAGSLDGTWGRVADIVSNAAVSGIRELFGVEEKSSLKRSPSPRFSGGPALPQVPGRAVPPP